MPSVMRMTIRTTLLLVGAAALLACSKDRAPAASDPAFEKKWAELAKAGVDVEYIEDDRAEGLMGSVRRASRTKEAPPPPSAVAAAGGLPQQLTSEEIQRVIRSNLAAVKGCYVAMARTGAAPSGKAIVTFTVDGAGKPQGVRVDAPTFTGTRLPTCLSSQISFWTFPRSQNGGGTVSYPFVFVGG